MAARVAAQGLPPLAEDERADLGQRPLRPHRLPGDLLLRRPAEEGPEEPRRGRPRDPQDLREARHPAAGARAARRRRRRRGLRQRLGGDHLQGQAQGGGRPLHALLRGGPRAPRAGQEVPRLGGAAQRQLLRRPQLGGVLRRLLRLRAQGGALPDGAVDLLPHQRQEHRPVRAHADRRRGGGHRLLPRGVHGADARREPAARRGGRALRPRPRHHQVLDGAELVPRRPADRQGRHLQLRHQARAGGGQGREDLVDAGRDRLGDHLEVPQRHPARRRHRSASSTRWR